MELMVTAEYNEDEEVITSSSINKIRTIGGHRGHVLPLPSLPKKGNHNARSRDTLIEQSVKYPNRTVTTHNGTFIVIFKYAASVWVEDKCTYITLHSLHLQ